MDMSRTRNKIVATLVAALGGAALGPSASLAYQDHRSPDQQYPAPAVQAPDYQDHRSPDAQTPVQGPTLSPAPSSSGESSDTDWGDIGIVAGGLFVLGMGGVVLFSRHKGTIRKSGTPAVPS